MKLKKYLGVNKKILYLRSHSMNGYARVAQLVEHNLAKVGVAGSNPVSRSKKAQNYLGFSFTLKGWSEFEIEQLLWRWKTS